MRILLRAILFWLVIAFGFFLIVKGNISWGIVLILALIIYLDNSALAQIRRELNWISEGITNDTALRNLKEEKALYYAAKRCFYDKIKKGMDIAEFAKIVLHESKASFTILEGIHSKFLRERAEEYIPEKENYTLIYRYGEGKGFLEELHFKFKNGRLVRIKGINQPY